VQTGQKLLRFPGLLLFEVEEKYLCQHVKHMESTNILQKEAKRCSRTNHHTLCTMIFCKLALTKAAKGIKDCVAADSLLNYEEEKKPHSLP
jgi:hypothetical protein